MPRRCAWQAGAQSLTCMPCLLSWPHSASAGGVASKYRRSSLSPCAGSLVHCFVPGILLPPSCRTQLHLPGRPARSQPHTSACLGPSTSEGRQEGKTGGRQRVEQCADAEVQTKRHDIVLSHNDSISPLDVKAVLAPLLWLHANCACTTPGTPSMAPGTPSQPNDVTCGCDLATRTGQPVRLPLPLQPAACVPV